MEALPAYNRNIPDSCALRYKLQNDWKFVEVLSFYLGGVGTGLYILSQLFGCIPGLIAGYLLVVVCKNGAHLLASSKPFRSMGVLSKPGSSWISRGAYGIFTFAVLGLLDIAMRSGNVSADAGLATVVSVLAGLAAFFIMAYVGFVFAEARNIGFWNSPAVPAIIVCYSFCMGYALFGIIDPAKAAALLSQFLVALVATAVLIFFFLIVVNRTRASAKQSVKMLTQGEFSMAFWGGVVVVGLLVPMGLVTYSLCGEAGAKDALLLIAGVLTLLGGLLFETCFIRAGIYNPVVDVAQND
jgi:formate-dependent nitrite reductase membrane component NrfD